MTIFTNTFTRFAAIGVREQLSNVIYNTDPTEVPFLTNAKVGKAKNTSFEWQTDALASASSTNQQLEGDDIASVSAVTATVRLLNYCEIARKTVAISNTLEAQDKAGRASEEGYQIAKMGKELKRDMETSLLANKAAAAGNTTTARDTGTFCGFVKTNISKAAGGTAPVYTATPNDVWTNGTQRAFTETILKAVLKLCYDNGADISTVMMGSFSKQAFSAFSGVVELTANQGRSQATIVGAASAYVSDWGTINIVPNRFCLARNAYFIDWDMVQVNYLRPFTKIDLAVTGDAKKRMLLAEYGLQVGNEKGLGLAVDLSTS